MEKSKNRIMIVDGLNLFFRSYAADPSVSTNGYHIGGVTGFLKSLQKYSRMIKPTHIAIAWDGVGGSKRRKQMNSEYKAGRAPVRLNRFNQMSEEEEENNKINQQIRLIEYLNAMPVKQFVLDNVEADDLIAWLCQQHYCDEWERVIVSNDKDFIQLLDDCTILIRPIKDEILNKLTVVESYGIHPTNFALARAVSGDKSDNLPGVVGVGLKTLAKRCPFLADETFVPVEQLVEFCEAQTKPLKIFESIPKSKDLIKDNYKIMQLTSPQISYQGVQQLKNDMNTELTFNLSEIKSYFAYDGIPEYMFSNLFDLFHQFMKEKHEFERNSTE